jgi:acyl transferase domain-containing protein/SAM-dependent methyltransferase/aryl carrier-like protein/dienelactone hydrolase
MNETPPSAELAAKQRLALTLKTMQARIDALETAHSEPIAIVGIGCRFPGGVRSPGDYWRLLQSGTDAISEVPGERWALDEWFDPDPEAPGKMYTRWGGFLDGVDQFDPRFFGISPREAISLDPQQRLLLEVTWEALEHAAIAADRLTGTPTGVFVGISGNDYAQINGGFSDPRRLDAYAGTGTIDSVAAGRISYILGLQGPNFPVDTACSSSLVAVHLACQSLRLGECRVALAAGVNLILAPAATVYFCKMRALSPTGRCHTFDARADGYVRGEGCGVVVLKRLSDAQRDGDNILAVIRGSAVNHDGRSNGLTAPNGAAQEAVLRQALKNAGIEPSAVGYIEAHGTGTSLGDPIEVQALAAVLGQGRSRDNPLLLGSVKTNIGHLESAAGVAGLIKAVLLLQHGEIPPHLHLQKPNPFIPWQELPVQVPTGGLRWPYAGPRLAGVSSFGFSGTNAHVILESAPVAQREPATPRPVHVLSLSARNDEALRSRVRQLADHLQAYPETSIADASATLNAGRSHFGHRLALVARTTEEARRDLRALVDAQETPGLTTGVTPAVQPRVGFLFTGQGSQYAGMGRQLYETSPLFRSELDNCSDLLRPHLDRPLLEVLYPDEGQDTPLDQTGYAQPALFSLEYALCRLWQSWGVQPVAVLGHSLGEYVAACVAGALSLEDALNLVATRARLMQALPPGGVMAALLAPQEQIEAALAEFAGRLSLAALNGSNTVVSGDAEAVDQLLSQLEPQGVRGQRLQVSHAFHSARMEPALAPFRQAAAGVSFSAPRLSLVSNLTGRLFAAGQTPDADYWCQHLRQPVRFAEGVRALRQSGVDILLEIGPQPTLLGMARRCLPEEEDCLWLPSLRRGQGDWQTLLESLAALYTQGVAVDWAGFHKDGPGRLHLPTYPFQRERFWVENTPTSPTSAAASPPTVHPRLGRRIRSSLWELLFETELGVSTPGFLNGHRFSGRVLVPAALYLDMALMGAAEALGTDAGVVIEGVSFPEPLFLPDGGGERSLRCSFRHAEGGMISFEVGSEETPSSCPLPEAERGRKTTPSSCPLPEAERGSKTEEKRPTRGGKQQQTFLIPPPRSGEGAGVGLSFHATGTIRLQEGTDETVTISLRDIRDRCREEVPADDFYRQLEQRGLELGPYFRGVERLARGSGEALGEVHLERPAGYSFFPPLLDTCLQVIGAAIPDVQASRSGYLLAGLDRFRVVRTPGDSLWSHATLRPDEKPDGDTLTGDVRVFDADGHVVAEAIGLHLRRVEVKPGTSRLEELLYQVEWRPQPHTDQGLPPDYLPSPGDLAERLQPLQSAQIAGQPLEHYRGLLPALEEVATAHMTAALRQLGWATCQGQSLTTGELADRLGVVPAHLRLLGRILEALGEDGLVERRGDGPTWHPARCGWQLRPLPDTDDRTEATGRLQRQYPACALELALLDRCGRHLAEVLRGRCDPLGLLFPEGDPASVEHLYQDSPFVQVHNGLIREAVTAILEKLPGGRTVRVLEVGAGTGGMTAHVLPRLPAGRTEYVFTDVSSAFLGRAAEKFRDYPFVRYQTLDVERDPETQGCRPGSFDLVLTANVLHATADLGQVLGHVRRLLAPGGLLLLLEVTARQRWLDLIFGLTEGWWRFTDTGLRPSHPLLSREQWETLLTETGFEGATVLPATASPEDGLAWQSVLATQAPVARMETKSEGVRPEGNLWLILADSGGVGRALATSLERLGQRFVLVRSGTVYRRLAAEEFEIDPTRPEEFERLLAEDLGTERPGFRGVVHLWGLDALADEDVPGSAGDCCRGALFLLQALGKAEWGQRRTLTPPRLWLATAGAQSVDPASVSLGFAHASLWGLGRVIAHEHPELWGGLIDLDPTAPAQANAEALLGQVWNPDGEDQTAFRAGTRHVARLVRQPGDIGEGYKADPEGSYLITGGLGGLGLCIARWLIDRGSRSLVLVGRGPGTDPVREAVRALEGQARVTVLRADVSVLEDVQGVLDEVKRSLPPLRGVVHAAGIFEDSTLDRQEWDGFARVLAPKVAGAWNLHTRTRDLPLDFFVLFSSAAAVLGTAGLGNYTAANAFLDGLAHYRRSLGLPGLSIEWGPWADVGMARAVGTQREQQWASAGIDPFSVEDGLGALDRLLSSGATQGLVVSARWPDYLAQIPAEAVPAILSDLAREVAGSRQPRTQAPGDTDLVEPLLKRAPDERAPLMATHLRRRLARVLNMDEQAIPDEGNLLDLGLDSLMVMELLNGLKRSLRLTLYPREFYDRPALGTLARYLTGEVERAHGQTGDLRFAICDFGLKNKSGQGESLVPRANPKSKIKNQKSKMKNPPAAFILSSPRSGSTLLRVMLEGHPALFSPPELHLLGFAGMGERQQGLGLTYMGEGLQRSLMELRSLDATAARALVEKLIQEDTPIGEVYGLLQEAAGGRLLVDKTPTYASSLETLQRAEELFDRPRYIFLTRHPYAVIESFTRMRMDKLVDAGKADPLTVAEAVWATTNGNVLHFFEDVEGDRCFRLAYEDLVCDPTAEMTRLCSFLGIPFDPAVLTPYEGRRMTDGVHAQSLGLNDPNFLQHDRIDTSLGEAWKTVRLSRPLGGEAREVARALGYELPNEPSLESCQLSAIGYQPDRREEGMGSSSQWTADSGQCPPRRERFVDVRGLQLCLCEWGPEDGSPGRMQVAASLRAGERGIRHDARMQVAASPRAGERGLRHDARMQVAASPRAGERGLRHDAVLCVHGILEQGASWEDVASSLVARGYCVIAPDLRGHGRSGHAESSSAYHLLDFVADLDQLSAALGGRPLLVGHSMGAVLAALLAAARPGRFRGLVLVEKPLPTTGNPEEAAEHLSAQLDYMTAPPAHPVFPDLADAARSLVRATPALSDERAQALAARITEPCSGGLRWSWDARLRTRAGITLPGLELSRYLTLLSRLRLPVRLVYGDSSGLLREGQLGALLDAMPQAEQTVLPGGHNLHLEAPAALARLIEECCGERALAGVGPPPVCRPGGGP